MLEEDFRKRSRGLVAGLFPTLRGGRPGRKGVHGTGGRGGAVRLVVVGGVEGARGGHHSWGDNT